ncbi:amino acid adenylation domain-containing protein [Pseudoalteromonas sp. J010]|uniref:non-ribosomal peptide synthetase n=1 Tax=Pseudoalteromonas sp. J010 TaxID=998465 RepID=UPI000FBEFFF1|nr:non-ribosomal peptide synthetase [Pseudoalteromonas sp. J010]RRS06556.1 amino acid adenylation domain-containing protein [Pseudoalteromonas sp. J010]
MSKFDLTLEFVEDEGALSGAVEYSTALFKHDTITALMRHFVALTEMVCQTPAEPIGRLDYLSDTEQQQLMALNDTKRAYDDSVCIHELFAEQAAAHPEREAVRYGDESLSYAQLQKRSEALAKHLQSEGVGPEVLVGICLERSIEMMVAIMAVLQAGGAYVPLDPEYPDERLSYMLENSPVASILTQSKFAEKVRALSCGDEKITLLDAKEPSFWSSSEAYPVALDSAVKPDNMAYVIYTSGSTGRPKGVMVTHKALMNRIVWMQREYQLTPSDVVLQKTPYSFDVSVWEFVWPMMSGATLVFAAPGRQGEPDYLSALINQQQVTTLHFVPSMLSSFLAHAPQQCPSVKRIFSSGEALGIKSATQFTQSFPNAALHNLYGPTEAAIDVTAFDCTQLVDTASLSSVPIGKPIDNIRLYILDDQLQLQPKGVPGELHIAGDGLARGYINQVALSAEKFINNPFEPGERMYKTGDLARWLADGNIEYLGRIDSQIKLRGFRIETAEIEYQLEQLAIVELACVVVQGEGVNQRLVAFVQSKSAANEHTSAQLKQHLSAVLPDYMVPAKFVILASLPLTASGKANRRALQTMPVTPSHSPVKNDMTNLSSIEKKLKLLWSEVLEIDSSSFNTQDNFFDIGGNSLTVVEVAARIAKSFDCEFQPAMLFKFSSIETIAEHLLTTLAVTQQQSSAASQVPVAVTNGQPESVSRPSYYADSLAIVGISCHFPQAPDHRAFWQNLVAGKESVVHLSPQEAEAFGVPKQIIDSEDYVALNTWTEEKAYFDPEFFKLSAGNAKLMDPQLRQLLMHSWKAVEDAGYLCDDIANTSVYMSVSNNSYQAMANSGANPHGVMENSEEFVSWLMAQGGTIPTMISYQLGFTGPSVFVHSNCSSSLASLYSAYQSLINQDADYALVGAASFAAQRTYGYLHQPGMNLSSDGHLKAFDNHADGMVEGEGVGVIMLRRAEDAIADGDHIYSLLRGIAVNNDGADKAGYYAPSVSGQSAVIQQVLKKTAIDPQTIHYVEAHGTGTSLGDPIEVMGLSEAFSQYTQAKQFCALGSVKANIGHLDTAAGLAGIIKLSLGLHQRTFPAQINYQTPNTQIDFEQSPFYVLDKPLTWDESDEPRRAALSAFGIGGTNTHAILEEYCMAEQAHHSDSGAGYIITLSARRKDVLNEYAQQLLHFVNSEDALSLASLAFTLQTGRKAFEHRLALVVENQAQLVEAISDFLADKESSLVVYNHLSDQDENILQQDEDFDALVRQWISKEKWYKVATVWSKGCAVDWTTLYPQGAPRKLSAPTYPFAKDIYWIDVAAATAQQPVVTTTGHPLLHCNTSDLTRQSYATTLTGGEFFLRDHQILGDKILPGVAYLEMARAALDSAVGGIDDTAVLELSNIVWVQPAVVDEEKTINLALTVQDSGLLSYEISSAEGTDETVLYCQGNAGLLEHYDAAQIDINDIMQRLRQQQAIDIDIEQFYADIAAMGTHFGTTFRALDSVKLTDQALVAEVTIPAMVNDTRLQLHPSLMDGALQSCLLLLAGSQTLPSETALPFAMDSLKVIKSCDTTMTVWARFAQGAQRTEQLVKMDLDLLNSAGEVCVEIRGFCSRVIAAETPKSSQEPQQIFAVPTWQAQPAPVLNEMPQVQHEVLLLNLPDISLAAYLPQAQCHRWEGSSAALGDEYQQAAVMCFELLQGILKRNPQTQTVVQLVTRNDDQGMLLLGLQGMLKTANLENPNIIGQLVFVDVNETGETLSQKLLHNLAELSPCVKYQGVQRQRLAWQVTEPQVSAEVAFKDDGVYVITGGTGGLGQIFAKEILQQASQAKVILTGRAAQYDLAELTSLAAYSAQVTYEQLEIDTPQSVIDGFAKINTKYGKVNGILHVAGMISDSLIRNKTTDSFRAVLQPKVAGTVYLDEATKQLELDFLVLFSSESALGSLGQADYAVANGFMDQYAKHRNQLRAQALRSGVCVSINWPLWQEGGMTLSAEMQAQAYEEMGMMAMASDAGVRAFYTCMAMNTSQVLVMTGDKPRLTSWLNTHTAAMALHQPAQQHHEKREQYVVDAQSLRARTTEYLQQQCAKVFKLEAQQIDPSAPLEQYGIDSILAISLTNQLEKTFGSLSKTLLFEYQSVDELTTFFVDAHRAKLDSLFGETQSKSSVPVQPSTPAIPKGLATTHNVLKNNRFSGLKTAVSEPSSVPLQLEDIAIVGISGRYPGADDVEAFWHNLSAGIDSISEIPQQRWDWQRFYSEDRTQAGKHYSNVGGFISGVEEFDPKFFNISPREASILDPQERLFLQHAWMAVEDAGYTKATLKKPYKEDLAGQVGVYVGVMYSEYQLYGAEASVQGELLGFACSLADIANRVSYVLNLHGPSMTVDTMCSSSLTAIHLACQDLKLGRIDFAISGGVNVNIHPNKYTILSSDHFISTTGRCKSFGEGGEGYIPGEGVGAVLLKRLSDAEHDGDHIYGVIKGSAINHGGKTNGYTVPNPQAQASAISMAIAEADIEPRHISYIEAHGTGTKLGDPIEVAALTKSFNKEALRDPNAAVETGYCLLGSAKSNIGHCEPAAGIAGLTKVLLQMKHKKVAPSLHSRTLNPHIDFAATPFVVNQTLTDWRQPVINGQTLPRTAGISSFGAGGSNGHMIVQEYIAPEFSCRSSASVLVLLSARTTTQLQQMVVNLSTFVTDNQDNIDLPSLAYTLQVGREAMAERLALVVNSVAQLQQKLGQLADESVELSHVYRGRIVKLKDRVYNPEDKANIAHWLEVREFDALAQKWILGQDVNWQQLYTKGDDVKRISLPTYPFAAEKYWWTDILTTDLNLPASTSSVEVLHPLLHRNTSILGLQQYSSLFLGNEPFVKAVATHQWQLPIQAQIEMAVTACQHALELTDHQGGFEVKEFNWLPSQRFNKPSQISVCLRAAMEGEFVDFEIFSEEDDEVLSQGKAKLNAIDSGAIEAIDLNQLQASLIPLDIAAQGASAVEVRAGFIDNASQKMLVMAAYQGQEHVAFSALSLVDELLALVQPLVSQPIQHHALSIAAMTSYAPCPKQCALVITKRMQSATEVVLDLDILDEHGKVCTRLQGISYQAIVDSRFAAMFDVIPGKVPVSQPQTDNIPKELALEVTVED